VPARRGTSSPGDTPDADGPGPQDVLARGGAAAPGDTAVPDAAQKPRGAGAGAPRQTAWARWLAGWTLRRRLIAGLVVLFTLASAAVALTTTIALRNFQLNQLDQQLNAAAHTFSISLEGSDGAGLQGSSGCPGGGPGSDNPPSTAGQMAGTFAARFKNGQVTYSCEVTVTNGRPSLSPVPLSASDLAALSSVPLTQQPYSRQLSGLGDYRLTAFAGADGDVHYTGLSLSGVEATVRQLEVIEVIVFGAALIVIGVAGTGWIRFSLRPLRRVTATAAEVTRMPLASGEVTLPPRVPDADPRTEVGQLGEAFNRMLGHVEDALGTREASEARLRQFIADASHELRTPLAGIRGYTELALRADGELDPDLRRALTRVDAESARMSRLVDDLLLLARLDAGRPLAHEQVDLTRLAIDVTNDARVAGPEHRWVLDLPGEPVAVTGDEHRLHQVLANLLTNARAHTPSGTTVTVRLIPASAGEHGNGVELTVSDDGPGIPAELQAGVWERFARGDSARSRKAGSTGLGLAIVAAVVTAHRGRVSLASRPGKTTFRIWLPSGGPGPAQGRG
jgi:two-component system, OmpR family, sensor kinase